MGRGAKIRWKHVFLCRLCAFFADLLRILHYFGGSEAILGGAPGWGFSGKSWIFGGGGSWRVRVGMGSRQKCAGWVGEQKLGGNVRFCVDCALVSRILEILFRDF